MLLSLLKKLPVTCPCHLWLHISDISYAHISCLHPLTGSQSESLRVSKPWLLENIQWLLFRLYLTQKILTLRSSILWRRRLGSEDFDQETRETRTKRMAGLKSQIQRGIHCGKSWIFLLLCRSCRLVKMSIIIKSWHSLFRWFTLTLWECVFVDEIWVHCLRSKRYVYNTSSQKLKLTTWNCNSVCNSVKVKVWEICIHRLRS